MNNFRVDANYGEIKGPSPGALCSYSEMAGSIIFVGKIGQLFATRKHECKVINLLYDTTKSSKSLYSKITIGWRHFGVGKRPRPKNVVSPSLLQLPPWSCPQKLRSYARVSFRRVIRASTSSSEVHTAVRLVCVGSLSLSPVEISLLHATRFAMPSRAFRVRCTKGKSLILERVSFFSLLLRGEHAEPVAKREGNTGR